ncbi:MAG: cysteine--tRNA ligase [Acidimicrobiales bacterium]
MLRLHDTETGLVRELALRDPGQVSLYVCGPTVYDLPHIGHGRSILTYDILRRFLEWSGLAVRHVSNVTDIDDNIIKRAERLGEDPADVARRYEAEWWAATDRLGALRPTETPRATAFVERMIEVIGQLVELGAAYQTSDGVYLAVDEVDGYGLLAQQDLRQLRATERVDEGRREEKRNPLDFVLWKLAKPGEPTWPSPWGNGRPGWHTECAAMSLDLLGDGFDLHAGGLDLKFPHHENERAHAVVLGRDFARHWMHHAFVVDSSGEKMSKSLDNFTSLTDLLERVDHRAYRLLLLQAHYRSPVLVDAASIGAAERSLGTLDRLARRAVEADLDPEAPLDRAALAPWVAAMEDDLNTVRALALVFDWAREANAAFDAGRPDDAARLLRLVREATAAVGLDLAGAPEEADPAALDLAAARDQAREARDWAAADRLRDDLVSRGWTVEDTPQGTRLRR